MKWVLREDNISALIEFGKENLSSDNYLFVTTKDMLGQIEMNLDTFCTKIQRKTIISGFEEKIDKKLEEKIEKKLEIIPNVLPKIMISKRALVIFSIKKELLQFLLSINRKHLMKYVKS